MTAAESATGLPDWLAILAWVGAGLACLPLVMSLINAWRFRLPPIAPPSGTRVSILIPARNEAVNIERSVRNALASEGVEVEVIVLDDQSTDDTAAIVARLQAEDPRVRLESAPPLPPGWAGKQRACQLLGESARHGVLMFVDADVEVAPGAAAYAAGRLLSRERLGMVSGFPHQITDSLAEKLVVPWIHLLLLGYLPMNWMRRFRSPAFAAACGQWIVARRDAWIEVGGHGAEPLSRHDGISLPRTFRSRGWFTDVFDGTGHARCRMYDSFATVWQGFGKSAGEGMATPVGLPVWALLIGGGHVLSWLLLPVAFAMPELAPAVLTGVGANLVFRLVMHWRVGIPFSPLLAVLHPFGAAIVLAINTAALVRHLSGRPSSWRGRHYTTGRREPPQAV